MKKDMILLAAVFALASCQGLPCRPELFPERSIVFGVKAGGAGPISDSASLLESGFTSVGVSGGKVLFNETAVLVKGEDYFAPNAQMIRRYYFPAPPATVDFFACFPPTQAVDVDNEGNAFIRYTQAGDTDLLAAARTCVTSSGGSVPLNFDHILSRVEFRCDVTAAEGFSFTLNSVSVEVPQTAVYSFSDEAWHELSGLCLEEFISDPVEAGGGSALGTRRTFIPGEYDIKAEWTVTCPDSSLGRFSRTLGRAGFEAGREHTVTLSFSDNSIDGLDFFITVGKWVDSSVSLELGQEP